MSLLGRSLWFFWELSFIVMFTMMPVVCLLGFMASMLLLSFSMNLFSAPLSSFQFLLIGLHAILIDSVPHIVFIMFVVCHRSFLLGDHFINVFLTLDLLQLMIMLIFDAFRQFLHELIILFNS